MSDVSRRSLLGAGGAMLGAAGLGLALPGVGTAAGGGRVQEERKSLDELYADALREGGQLVVYAGGDTSDQQDFTKQAFLSRFPDIRLTLVVDYSKFHDVRVDHQLATRSLVPDIVQLQTLHDFTRWKKQGVLQPYKPAGFSKLYKDFADPDGAWVSIGVIAFSYLYNVAAVGGNAPRNPLDLIDPRWKDAIASAYPHDDDAVLYLYYLYAKAYGREFMVKLAEQNPQFARGSHTPPRAVGSGQKAIGIGSAGSLTAPATAPMRWAVADGHPFMAWGQRSAILAGAAHPAAAKLFLNWQLSPAVQQNSWNGWSVRTDVTPAGGLKPIWQYPNANLEGFPRFMADRAEVERWKQTFALYFGDVQGAPSPGVLGLYPGR